MRTRPFDQVTRVVSVGVCLALLFPVGNMILRTFVRGDDRLAVGDVTGLFGDSGTLEAIRNTVIILLIAGPCAIGVGGLLAWLNERTDARIGLAGDVLPIASLLVPPIAGSIAWTLLFSPRSGFANVLIRDGLSRIGINLGQGPVNVFSWYGVIFAYCAYMIPYAYLPIAAALRSLDPALEEAGRVNGSSSLQVLWRITVPAIKPAILTATFLVTVICVGIYSVPSILGTRSRIDVVSVVIVRKLKFSYPPDVKGALLLGFLLLAVVAVVWLLQSRAAGSGRFARIAPRGQSDNLVRLGRWRIFARIGLVGYLVAMSVVPLAALAFVSLQRFWTPHVDWSSLNLDNYRALFGSTGGAARALRNSLWLGLVGATIGVLLAVFAAFYLRRDRSRFSRVVDGVLKLPGNMSHIVLAIAFVLAFAGPPFRLGNTRWILLLAFVSIYVYQAVLQSSDALSRVGDDLIDASHTSGHGITRTVRWVVLPLMAPGLVASWILFFVHIIGDVNAAAILAGTKNQVVGSELVNLYEGGQYTQLAALATVLSAVSMVFVLSSLGLSRLMRRRT
ncbi:MAG TPA: iron ABC transporter permease [Ilumatobacteraceae bacterium]|nr:iron ABC transporter permease [Ilumatobacteraceae bacterium]